MLELCNVSVCQKRHPLLKDITLSLKSGRITVLLGKNGSGKTTLLRAINRELPYSGTIRLVGDDNASLSPRERAKRAALLHQILPTPTLTVRELVSLGRTPYRPLLSHATSTDIAVTETALEAVGLLPLAERLLPTLSGGERQRAYLAMILAQEAPLILLDEPTSYLDADARHTILTLLRNISTQRNRTALVVLHDVNDAIRLADDLLLLSDGQLLFHGERERFLAEKLPERAFGLARHDTETDPLPFYY